MFPQLLCAPRLTFPVIGALLGQKVEGTVVIEYAFEIKVKNGEIDLESLNIRLDLCMFRARTREIMISDLIFSPSGLSAAAVSWVVPNHTRR